MTPTSHVSSSGRIQRVLLASGAGVLARVVGAGTLLITIPLTLRYLGPEQFGVYATITSFMAMLSFADLGIGNGLVNAIAEARAKGDAAAARVQISSAYAALGVVALLVVVVAGLGAIVLDVDDLGFVSPGQAGATAQGLAVFVVCFALGIPLGVPSRVQTGRQEIHLSSLWSVGSSLLSLATTAAAVWLQAGLPWLILASAGTPLVAQGLNGAALARRESAARPAWSSIDRRAIRSLLKEGSLFFVLQVCSAVVFATDNLVVAKLSGAEAVAEYAVVARLFSLGSLLVTLTLGPLWPAYRDAHVRGETTFLRKTLRTSLALAFAVSAGISAVLLYLGPWLGTRWAGLDKPPSTGMLLGFGLFTVILAVSTAYATFMNGTGLLRFQAVFGVLTAALALTMKIEGGTRFGPVGVVVGTALAVLAGSVFPFAAYVPRRLARPQDRRSSVP